MKALSTISLILMLSSFQVAFSMTSWGEVRKTYYKGYTWVKSRRLGDVIKKFLCPLREWRYETEFLKRTAPRLDNMARTVVLRTDLSRDLKYRIGALCPCLSLK